MAKPRCTAHGLAANVGLRVEFLGFFMAESTSEERAAAEAKLRAALDAGVPCALVNMENQLITGYDDTGFLSAQPWACNDFPPKRLTFGTWDELGDGIHMDFLVLRRCEPAEPRKAVLDSLWYAVDLWRNPTAHTREPYAMGPGAYAAWSAAVQAGDGGGHGNWWNAVVWAECRARAADYVREIGALLPASCDVEALASSYAAIADLLNQCSDKELEGARKVSMLAEAAEREGACVERIEQALVAMG